MSRVTHMSSQHVSCQHVSYVRSICVKLICIMFFGGYLNETILGTLFSRFLVISQFIVNVIRVLCDQD